MTHTQSSNSTSIIASNLSASNLFSDGLCIIYSFLSTQDFLSTYHSNLITLNINIEDSDEEQHTYWEKEGNKKKKEIQIIISQFQFSSSLITLKLSCTFHYGTMSLLNDLIEFIGKFNNLEN